MSEQQLLPPIHPGEILAEEFLQPMNISQYRLAKDIGVSPRRINEIVHGNRGISANTALLVSRLSNHILSGSCDPKWGRAVILPTNGFWSRSRGKPTLRIKASRVDPSTIRQEVNRS